MAIKLIRLIKLLFKTNSFLVNKYIINENISKTQLINRKYLHISNPFSDRLLKLNIINDAITI